MSRDLRSLDETIHSLINVSDHLESIRSKIKDPRLLKGQEYLVAAIEECKQTYNAIKATQRKESVQEQEKQAHNFEVLDNWKKEQEQKLIQNYRTQKEVIQKDVQGTLKKESLNVLQKEYHTGLRQLEKMYKEYSEKISIGEIKDGT